VKLNLTMTIAALGALAAGLATAPTADAQSRGAPRGSYQATCSGAYVNQGRLYADCRDQRGRMRETSIELSRCSSSDIGNDNGLLVCNGHRGSYEDRPGGGGGGGGGGSPSVTFFADSDFRGGSITVTGETAFLSSFNDRASSARVNGSWEVCEDARFGGRCERIDRDVRNFTEFGLNDRISSVRASRGGGGGWGGNGGMPSGRSTITVFRDANYSGGSETLRGEIPDLSRLGLNDAISSMRMNGRWEICTDANFSGQCEVFDGDVRNLGDYPGFNDRISSLRPLRGRW
jgi:hypothetical protein